MARSKQMQMAGRNGHDKRSTDLFGRKSMMEVGLVTLEAGMQRELADDQELVFQTLG